MILLLWYDSSLFGIRISKGYIQVPVRHIDFASMEPGEDPISSTIPMVSISSMSGEAHIWTTYERLAVEAYLQQLKDHGYFVPTFHIFELSSYRREKAILF